MKRKLTILTLFVALCSFAFGQDLHWKPNINTYNGSMGIEAIIYIDNVEQRTSTLEVGAFVGDEVRGSIILKHVEFPNVNIDSYRASLLVYGDETADVTFRLYDHENKLELNLVCATKVTFKDDDQWGDLLQPKTINFFTPVAEVVDGDKYATLQEAIDAATDGQTVKLLSNIEISNGYNDKEFVEIKAKEDRTNITLDLNNYAISQVIKDNGLSGVAMTVRAGQHLTITDNSTDKGGKISACSSVVQLEGGLTLAGGTLEVGENPTAYELNPETGFAYAVWMYIRDNATQYPSFNMTGGQIKIADKMIEIHSEYNYANAVVVNDYTEAYNNTKVNIEGGEFNGTIVVAEGTETTGSVLSNKVLYRYDAEGTRVAKTAIEFNDSFEKETEFKVGANIQGSGVVINKDVTIDFGGHTYTFTSPAVGSNGTQTLGFQILKGHDVVLKNGTLNVAEEAGESFAMLIQNYSDLTITNMTLDGDNLNRNNYSYVLSVNCGNVIINGSTSILANEVEGEKHFAFDSYDYSAGGYTELPTVTVNTTGAIKGAIEVSATLDIKAIGEESAISYISIEGKGQLFHNGIATTIKKNIEGTATDGWYTISSPVGNVTHENVSGLINGTHDLFRYNETTMIWENVKVATNGFTTLEAGRGYLYANTADTELGFKGTLNTAAASQELTITDNALSGFNLVGNPFTYNITKDNMWGATLAQGFYTLSNHGAWQANNESATIAPMQGALIKATALTGDFTINPNSAKRGESEDNGSIKINVANGNYNDLAYVSFNEGIGLDKIDHRNVNVPMVYVPVDGVNYAIAMMSQDVTEIPVSFRAMTMGEYTIAVEAQNCEFAMMTLVDRLTGVETNLLIEDYTFIAKTNDNPNRFFIKLAKANNNDGSEENFAFINNNMMYIYNIEGQGVVNVYDVTGRPVAEFNVSESANISTSDFASGMYIIRMSDENGIKVQKIVIE